MDSYLEIAQRVLQASRRPMTAAGILDAAYKAQIVPKHLFGKTQEKTLQARLSEDILYNNNVSAFFRTEPGYFFLTELVTDPNVPTKFKEKFQARRRARDLLVAPFLALDRSYVASCDEDIRRDWKEFVKSAERSNAIHYLQSKKEVGEALIVWTFSVVRKGTCVLAYRTGRYRSDEDPFTNKRTIGFPGVVSFYDCTLFSDGDYGASENALSAVLSDLDISAIAIHASKIPAPEPKLALQVERKGAQDVLLLIMEWACPEWFEPTTRRLSLNDPHWIDVGVQPNNLEDFEPWTLLAFERFFNAKKRKKAP